MIRIAIVGSRDFPDMEAVKDYLEKLKLYVPAFTIITGGAKGVDQFAEDWANRNGIDCEVIRPVDPADKFSYLLRNVEIITKADQIIAFWDGKSKGTKFVLDYAKARSRFIRVINYSKRCYE